MRLMLINELTRISIFIILMCGIWLIFSDSIISLFKRKLYSRFRVHKSRLSESRFFRHIYLLIAVTTGKEKSFYGFIVLTFSIFIISFILFINNMTLIFAVGLSIIFAGIPYMYLYIRLNTIRTEGSYEADVIVSELINQYKINYFNMIEAIDCLVHFKEAPICRKAFYRLSLKLKEYKREEMLQEALKEVTFMVNTDWMRMLVNNIYFAIEWNTNVTIGLEDILQELKEAKTTMEKGKQINSEGFSILKYLAPFMYIATIYISVEYFGFTVKKFLAYQLYTTIGIKFFALIVFLMVINILCMILYNKQKFDF